MKAQQPESAGEAKARPKATGNEGRPSPEDPAPDEVSPSPASPAPTPSQLSQLERAASGQPYGGGFEDATMHEAFVRARLLCERYNATSIAEVPLREELLGEILGAHGTGCVVETPFRVDYGRNITVGDHFYANTGCVMLDCGPIQIGDHVMLGPQVGIYTPCHPIGAEARATGMEVAKPVRIGNDVWVGGHATLCPGVTVGDDVVIGAGSVVTHDIPSHVVAVGNPCRVLRPITDEDRASWNEQVKGYFAQMEALGARRKPGGIASPECAKEEEEPAVGTSGIGEPEPSVSTPGATAPGAPVPGMPAPGTATPDVVASAAASPSLPLGSPAPMRRARQALTCAEALGLLAGHAATSGTLALNDPELGAPYVVPISYAYASNEGPELGTVYFHGATSGRKVELARTDGRASFCAIVADDVVPESFSTRYRSVVATGRLEVVSDAGERLRALRLLGHTYAPDLPPSATEREIDGSLAHTCVLALRVAHVSGKEAKSLAAERRHGKGEGEKEG